MVAVYGTVVAKVTVSKHRAPIWLLSVSRVIRRWTTVTKVDLIIELTVSVLVLIAVFVIRYRLGHDTILYASVGATAVGWFILRRSQPGSPLARFPQVGTALIALGLGSLLKAWLGDPLSWSQFSGLLVGFLLAALIFSGLSRHAEN